MPEFYESIPKILFEFNLIILISIMCHNHITYVMIHTTAGNSNIATYFNFLKTKIDNNGYRLGVNNNIKW